MAHVELDVIRFYNGQGIAYQQNFVYTKPDTDFRDENGNAYYAVNAPPKSFFNVAFELETETGGVWRIGIHKEITDRFGERGLVRVDANAKHSIISDLERQQKDAPENLRSQIENAVSNGFHPPEKGGQSAVFTALAEHMIMTAIDGRFAYVAFDDKSAKVKGDALWRKYLRQKIEDFEHENDRRVTERGTTPLRPNNFIAHAYKELGMEVPGDEKFIKAGVQQTEVSELKTTVAKQAEQIEQLLALARQNMTAQAGAHAEGQQAKK